MPTLQDIVGAIESFACPGLQESWDNTGWQLTPTSPAATECTGVLVCLDVTPERIDEAVTSGCNLVISHHPLIFRGLKSITGATPAERTVIRALSAGVAVYSSHTALDSASSGVSHELGRMLGLTGMEVLVPGTVPGTGLGVIGTVDPPVSPEELVARVKEVYCSPVVRRTAGRGSRGISRIALCSGSGGEFITTAIDRGACAYVTSDVRYHDFLDHGREILIVDTGHYESEKCTKSIFSRIISEKFPNFAIRMPQSEHNPVSYE